MQYVDIRFRVGQRVRVKQGYEIWYKSWAEDHRLFGMKVITALRDGDMLEIVDFHKVDGELWSTIEASGVGGSIPLAWLEVVQ